MHRRQSLHAALAQLVEHRIRNAGVVGSNPISGTIFHKPLLNLRFCEQIGWPIFDGSNPISGTIFHKPVLNLRFCEQIGWPIFDGSNPISGTIFSGSIGPGGLLKFKHNPSRSSPKLPKLPPRKPPFARVCNIISNI